MNFIDVFSHGTDGVCEYRIPVLLRGSGGTLIAACDARVDRPGDAPNNIDLVCRRSFDGGGSWSDLQTVVRYPGNEAASNPCGVVDYETGRVWLFYTRKPDGIGKSVVEPGLSGDRTVTAHGVFSDDDGEHWSDPVDITPMVKLPNWTKIAIGPGNGMQARDGTLILAMNRNHGVAGDRSLPDQAYVVCSKDHGQTWRMGGLGAPDTNEAQAVELRDGSIMLNCRSNRGRGCRAVSMSRDSGATWGPFRDDLALVEPVCQGSIIRAGDLLVFSNPASSIRGDRRSMTVRASSDDGETWPFSKLVYAGISRYSCLCELADGEVGLLFERDSILWGEKGNANAALSFTKLALDELRRG